MSGPRGKQSIDGLGIVLHWYDFLCPFCYIAQQRNAILVRHGLHVIELAFQAHPEIPPGGISAESRIGSMYAILEREAEEAGLTLRWPPHLPNTRLALAAAEWTRRHNPRFFSRLQKSLFEAHFVLGEDLEDPNVIDRHASGAGIELEDLHAALTDGTAAGEITETEMIGRNNGVRGTPAWLLHGRLIVGLQPAADFERFAKGLAAARRT